MQDIVIDIAESVFKSPRPDDRRETTDSAFRLIVAAETEERRAKSERLRSARLAAAV